ncbi:hypothetical protein OGAPHI_005399 [Ogataea philodendri]|uniref:Ornithine aminotransferase n=1 Tax=Ogataea philodendri TaxID=1378263 RepID=A0A9P8T2Q4_9ASCO|nr:uncharacterized protein OGAPHI_005399 [Ogataea philodendri]KAH3663409.1 hypothetical protein OGAPHI_005399 [Ogataea philodendri]
MSESTASIIKEYENCKGGFTPMKIPIAKAKNATLWDMDGKKYIDFLSFFAVTNMGHAHPKIVDAACEAIRSCPMVNTALINPSYARLASKIHEYLGYERIVCMCTGADCTDAATKIARKWGYQKKKITPGNAFVLTTTDCYHGITISTHSLASTRKTWFEPYVPSVGPVSPSGVTVRYGNIDDLREALEEDSETIAAFMVEPIQGSAGIVTPPANYLREAYLLCKKYNVLFIADEVQTGLGRTGELLQSWASGIKPDLVCLGKALAGGVAPLSAVCGNPDVMDLIEEGDIGSTMAASPPATSAAVAALEVLVEENISKMSARKGTLLRELMLEEDLEQIIDMSGSGMLSAAVLNPKFLSDSFSGRKLQELCAENGLIVNSAAGGTRVRICPPPTIEDELLIQGVKIFAKCVRELAAVKQ